MPTVSAPTSLAMRATTGAAPEPVPPPSPAVTKTMSEPRRTCLIWSYDSSAARRPTSGSAPEPRPCVSSRPDMQLDRRFRGTELLDVGVDGDELDLRDPRVDHPVDRVEAGAADPDDADHGEIGSGVGARHSLEARRRRSDCRPVARSRGRPSSGLASLSRRSLPRPWPRLGFDRGRGRALGLR